ncbi:MAG: hypothetical protein M5R37_03420 [Melioribacteraceae bacterium]|nr:hypothetical protein [Melioribacteraceae bacterium]
MLEREVKFIYDFNSNKVKKLGSTATFSELLPLGIHPAILQYISAEIEYRIFEDRQTLLKHSMFDYSGPQISKHFHKIADEIKKEKKFSTDFLSKVILHATSFNVNYLIRPNWSLKKLIFDNAESTSVTEINQILNYAYFYKHLIKVIRNYFDKKKLITLGKDEFSNLLVKFDNVSLQSYGNDILESAVKSMSSFFNIGSMNQKAIPLQAIAVFLKEKNLESHIDLLQNKLAGETKNKIDANDLRNILLGLAIPKTEIIEIERKDEIKVEKVQEQQTEEVFETKEEKFQPEEHDEEIEEREEFTESHDDLIERKTFEDDVEIKLRSNKEKEVSNFEEEEVELDDQIQDDEILEEENQSEEISELAEADDPAEYLLDQAEENTEVILSVDDYEDNDRDDNVIPEVISANEEEPNEHELLEYPDEEEKSEFVEDEEQKDNNDLEEDEPDLIIEEPKSYDMPAEVDDDYSFPISDTETKDEAEVDGEYITDEDLSEEELKDREDELEIDTENELNEEDDEPDEEIVQQNLFDDTLIPKKDSGIEDEFIKDFGTQSFSKRIDIADLLENRNMTRIIEVIFDYDMEEFANAIERICDSSSRQEAFGTLQEIFEVNQVNPSSKEAQTFRDIISEYFDQN